MKSKKGIIRLLLLFCLALAGCSSNTTGDTDSSSESESDNKPKELTKLVIAEPVHLIGYLPLYTAIREGYFEEEGLEVEVITATGGAHVTSVVGGDAWGVIGGPESNAMANVGSPDPIISVVNVVNRANVYLMADTELTLEDDSTEGLTEFLKGKTIAAGRFGGSPNLLTRWLLMDLGLDPATDVKLEEPADAAAVVALVENGQAHIANGAEPQINEGKNKEIWGEPFYSFTSLGDYPYSVISVKQSSIDDDPETVQSFVNAMLKALTAINEDKELAMKVLKAEFSTTSEENLQAALDRAYADKLWSLDGIITEESLAKTLDVVNKTGVFKEEVKYDELINMEFVEAAE